MNTWTSLSNEIAAAVDKAAPSIVQVHGHRRVTAGIVIADNLIATPAATDDDTVAVLTGADQTAEGAVLGRIGNMGLTVVRVDGLNRPALALERRRDGDARADRRRRRSVAHRSDGRDRSRDSHPAVTAWRPERRRLDQR
jgi:hypothetical protein